MAMHGGNEHRRYATLQNRKIRPIRTALGGRKRNPCAGNGLHHAGWHRNQTSIPRRGGVGPRREERIQSYPPLDFFTLLAPRLIFSPTGSRVAEFVSPSNAACFSPRPQFAKRERRALMSRGIS